MPAKSENQSKRPTRSKRRRSSSPASAAFDEVATSSQREASTEADNPTETLVPQRKRQDRRKRETRSSLESVDELADATFSNTGLEGPANDILDSSQQTSSSKKVRFSSDGANGADRHDGNENENDGVAVVVTPTEVTPHMKKTTLDSSASMHFGQSTLKNKRAQSTPANIPSSPSGPVQQIQFSPLRDVLNGRMRRRLRRSHLSEVQNEIEEHKREDVRRDHELERLRQSSEEKDRRLRQLMLELELQKQMSIDIAEDDVAEKEENARNVQQKHDEIAQIKEEMAHLRSRVDAAHGSGHENEFTNMDMDMDNSGGEDTSLVLVEPSDINMSNEKHYVKRQSMQLTGTPMTSNDETQAIVDTSYSMIDIPDPAHEAERKEFEKALTNLSRKLSDAQSTLQILAIELQTLGFSTEDASPEAVISAIRNVFQHARVELHEMVPGQVNLDEPNGNFLHVLVLEIKRLSEELGQLNTHTERQEEMEVLLRSQLDGVLNKLAEVDSRNNTLIERWRELDQESERKEKELVELNSQVEDLEEESQEQETELNLRSEKIKEMQDILSESSTTIERLQYAIQSYRDEVAGLEALNAKLETEYKAQISKMESDYTNELNQLKESHDKQSSLRLTAENEIYDKTTEIGDLKLKIENASNEVDKLSSELENTRNSAESQTERAETAEQDLTEKNDLIAQLNEKVLTAESTLSELYDDLRALENLVTAERRQREEAENLLDQRAEEIESLKEKLTEAGTAANQLRQKLFEVQQEREKEGAQSKHQEKKLNEALQREDERANVAEGLYTDTFEKLKLLSSETARERENLLADLSAKDTALNERRDELVNLQDTIDTLVSKHSAERAELEEQDKERLAFIQNLKNETAELSEKIASLVRTVEDQTVAHEDALQSRDENERQLQNEISNNQQKIKVLEAEKRGLETRIGAEAEELLNTQANHADEVSALNTVLAERQREISKLMTERSDLQTLLDSTTTAKNAETEVLRQHLQAKNLETEALSARNRDLSRTLATRIAKEQHLLERIAEDAKLFTGEVTKASGMFVGEGERILQEIEAEEAVGGDVGKDLRPESGFHTQETSVSSSMDNVGAEGALMMQPAKAITAVASATATARKVTTKRRVRKREFDSGVGLAEEERVDENVEEVAMVEA